MKRLYSFVLLSALACVFAPPARAAWTPNLPGWSVHEVPLRIPFVGYWPYAITLDPLTGDVFLLGYDAPGGGNIFLYRVSQTGQVQNLAPIDASSGPPIFDPVHRVVLLPNMYEIKRFTETGAPLSPIDAFSNGDPIAVAPDGELYALVGGGQTPTGLRIMRYDPALNAWTFVRDVPPQTESYPPLYDNSPQGQLQIDAAGRMFASPTGSTLFRIDESATAFIGYTLLSGGIAAGADRVLLGLAGFDPEATTAYSPQSFATPTAGHASYGGVVAPDGSVIFLSAAQTSGGGERYWLQIFTMAPTPAVQSSWGALKSLGR
jgi:hypothetical protein